MDLAKNADRVQSVDLQPPPELENWIKADFDLVRALQTLALVGSLIGFPHVAALQQLLSALRLFRRATTWLRWLLSGENKKSGIRSRYPRIRSDVEAARAGGAFGDLLRAVAEASRVLGATAPDVEVEDGWLNSSADLTALLENLTASGGTKEEKTLIERRLLSDALSAELAEKISQVDLDVRLVDRELRPYQMYGAKFAVVIGRGLLGDDMGLGKTVQALAAIAHVISTGGEEHHIVICPAALIDNWLREIKETTPTLAHWAFRERDHGRQAALDGWCAKGGILLTSYEQSEHLIDADLPSIGFVIVDEAHYVKNATAKRTGWTRQLLKRADKALLMGGTMLKNRTEELILLVGLANPAYEARLRQKFDDGSTAHHQADEFRHALGDFYLRRNQSKVLKELPGIVFTEELVAVGQVEDLAYREELKHGNLNGARIALAAGDGEKSKKIEYLSLIVRECKEENRKLLIFTEFLKVLDTAAKVIGDECLVIHGRISDSKRPDIMESFRSAEGFAALAMQIRVGGVGHNLQAASVVVLMEPQYKPSTEWQAVARAHRMGQPRRVSVHRLVAKNSFEERIVELTDFKAELFDKLARHSELAESSFADRDQRVNQRQLLADERQRLGINDESDE
ncbi:MAG: DEAD/DEAH box helicase [Pyrinomonadaceae bacterium]